MYFTIHVHTCIYNIKIQIEKIYNQNVKFYILDTRRENLHNYEK